MRLPDQQHHPLPAQAPPGEGKATGREEWETQPRVPPHEFLTRVDASLNRHKSEDMINKSNYQVKKMKSFISESERQHR